MDFALFVLQLCAALFFTAVAADFAAATAASSSSASNPMFGEYYLDEHVVASHSLSPPFVGDDMTNVDWDYGGDTIVDINKFVRLAPDSQSRTGWLWSKKTIALDSWTTEVHFGVRSGTSSSLVGDGLAFWFTRDRFSGGHAMGFKTRWHGLGIILDTYDNGNHGFVHPRIAVFKNNGDFDYSKENDGRGNEIGSCDADVLGNENPNRIRVTYRKDGYLRVDLATDNLGTWTECLMVTNATGVSQEGFFGFTAATGALSANFDIFSISTHSNPEQPVVESRPHGAGNYKESTIILDDEAEEAWLHTLVGLMVIVGVCVLGLHLGRRYYRGKRARDMKRF